MKKTLLGLMTLSTIGFANSNPGTPTAASVPVLVKAEIVEPSDSLQITDLAGQLLPQIVLDHGRIVKGSTTNSSVAYQDFKVIKGDGNNGLADLGGTGAKLAVAIDKVTTDLLNKTTVAETNKLTSNLSLLGGKAEATASTGITGAAHGYVINEIAAGMTEHRGRISSEITPAQLNGDNSVVGTHDNGSDTTLYVLYTPVTTQP